MQKLVLWPPLALLQASVCAGWGAVSCEVQRLLLLAVLSLWEIFLVFIVLCFQGKQ